MDNTDQPKPAGEWTELLDEAAFRCSATTQDERKRVISELVNAAIAAEFKRGKLEGVFASPDDGEVNYVRGLEQQLAAEREKVQTLVDALTEIARQNEYVSSGLAGAALAKVK